MTQAIVNLALPVIADKVKAALDDVANNSLPTQSMSHLFREELVTYVLRRVPTIYAVAESSRVGSRPAPVHCFSKEQQNHIDVLIQEGIDYLLDRPRRWEPHAQSTTHGVESSPSHWFG
jgi:hypothetical protein